MKQTLKTLSAIIVLLLVSVISFLHCTQTTKPPEKLTVTAMNDTTVYAGDTVNLYAVSSFSNISAYYWSFDGGLTYPDTTAQHVIEHVWQESDTGIHTIAVKVSDNDGRVSDTSTARISVVVRPLVVLSGDSISFSGDTARYMATITSGSTDIVWYLWSIDNPSNNVDTLHSKKYRYVWSLADTGKHMVYVRAQSTSGEISFPDSFAVFVCPDMPVIHVPADTTIACNDTIRLTVQGISQHATITSYRWTVDSGSAYTVTSTNSFVYMWPLVQAGTHSVSVRAVDSRGSLSESANITIHVQAMYPQLTVPRDTLISRTDTSLVIVHANGVGGARIAKYFWAIGSLWWSDSSLVPQKKILYAGKDTVSILVGAQDSRGIMSIDSFHIYFNAPPEQLRMIQPKSGDTILYHMTDSTFMRKAVTFSFSALDRNAPRDTITYSLYAGASPSVLEKIYEGRDTFFTKSGFDTTAYFWKLVAKDRFGDSSQISGTFRCFLQHLICFAGHSVAVGFDSDGISGGYRKKVLDSLRARFGGGTKRVKCVGPFITGFMANAVDDSCFAVGGFTSKALMQIMYGSYPALTADIWVVMLGSNESYSQLGSLMKVVSKAHSNNPNAFFYVFNALPLKESYGMDQIYNSWFADSIATKKRDNWNIWGINIYNVFTQADTANPLLFTMTETPILHPNLKGYDTLATMILDTMKVTLH